MLLKCASWNINGVFQRVGQARVSKLELDECKKLLSRYDVFGLTETHACSEDTLDFQGYKSYHKHRKRSKGAKRNSGGISVYIKETIVEGVKWLNTRTSEYAWLFLDKGFFNIDHDIYMAFVYLNPTTSTFQNSDNLMHLLMQDVAKFSKNGRCMVLGDLNGRTGMEADFAEQDYHTHRYDNTPVPEDYEFDIEDLPCRRNCDMEAPDERGKDILEMCVATGLRILNGRLLGDWYGNFTCHAANANKPSTIDYGLAHKYLLPNISYFQVEPFTHLSDHCIINLGLEVNYHLRNKVYNSHCVTPLNGHPDRLVWDKSCIPHFQEIISSSDTLEKLSSISKCSNAEVALSDFNDILWQSAIKSKMTIRKKRVRKRRKIFPKYVSSSCFSLLKQVKKLCRKISEQPYNRHLRQMAYAKKKAFKKAVKQERAKLSNQLMQKLESLHATNPQEYWRVVNELERLDSINFNDQTSGLTSDQWVSHFSNLTLKELNESERQGMDKKIKELKQVNTFSQLDYRITLKEIDRAVGSLKSGKAAGPDMILNEMVKASYEFTAPTLCSIFNLIFSSGKFPKIWSFSHVKPLHKGGSIANPGNFRGISLMSSVGKVFCSVLNNRLTDFLTGRGVPGHAQIGFKKGARTSDHILTLKSIINKYINTKRGKVFVAFVDFEKAFDSVWRQGLYYKLLKHDIRGYFFNIIEDMYENYQFSLTLGEGVTDKIDTNTGVKQGCVISPTLFNFYLADLTEKFTPQCDPVVVDMSLVYCLMYADDLVLISQSDAGLQTSLNRLQEYCSQWHLKINVSKTKVIVFNKAGHMLSKYRFCINDNEVEIARSYKYLGVTFNAAGGASFTAKCLRDKALKAIFKLNKAFNGKPANVKIGLHLFDTLIKPILLYNSEVWGANIFDFHKLLVVSTSKTSLYLDNCIERMHLSWLKGLLGVNKYATSIAVLAEVGRFPLALTVALNIIKAWTRILSLDPESFVYKSYIQNLVDLNCGKPCWIKAVRDILLATGYDREWYNQQVEHPQYLLQDLEVKLQDIFLQQWRLDMNDDNRSHNEGNKLRTYRKFKEDYKFEPYLKVKNPHQRKNITRLRISAHRLEIERGRHSGPKVLPADRLCRHCNAAQVEDEVHLVMQCPKYNIARTRLFGFHSVTSATSEESFIEIMKCSNINDALELGIFLDGVIKDRGGL